MKLSYEKPDGSNVSIRLMPRNHAQPVTLGRGRDASVILDDPKASRIHTAIRYWDDIFIVRDMNSSNGTFLNGEKIGVAKIAPGDIIQIGDTRITVTSEPNRSDVTVVDKQHTE